MAPRSSPRRRKLLLAVAASVVSVLAAYTGVLPVFRGELQRYLGIDDPRFGLLFALGPLAGVATVLLGGAMVNRVGPVRLIRLALAGVATSMLIIAAGGNRFAWVLAGCATCGAFTGPLYLATQVYLTRLFPQQRRRILALNMAIVCAGGILLPLLAEGLLALTRAGWGVRFEHVLRWPLVLVAASLLLASLAYRSGGRPRRVPRPCPSAGMGVSDGARPSPRTAKGVPPGVGAASARWRRGLRSFLLPLPVAWLVGMMAVHSSFDSAIMTWMPRFLGGGAFQAHPLPPGWVLSAYLLAYFVSRTVLAWLPEAWGRRVLIVLPGLAGGSVMLAGVLSRSFWLTAGGYVLGGFCWSPEFPTLMGMIARRGRQFGPALAVFQVLVGLGASALTYAAGQAAGLIGEESMWKIMAVLACGFFLVGLGGAAWLVFLQPSPKAPEA